MGYVPGTRIDLSYINRTSSGGSSAISKSMGRLVDVGTQFMFRLVDGHIVSARRIEVAFS